MANQQARLEIKEILKRGGADTDRQEFFVGDPALPRQEDACRPDARSDLGEGDHFDGIGAKPMADPVDLIVRAAKPPEETVHMPRLSDPAQEVTSRIADHVAGDNYRICRFNPQESRGAKPPCYDCEYRTFNDREREQHRIFVDGQPVNKIFHTKILRPDFQRIHSIPLYPNRNPRRHWYPRIC